MWHRADQPEWQGVSRIIIPHYVINVQLIFKVKASSYLVFSATAPSSPLVATQHVQSWPGSFERP